MSTVGDLIDKASTALGNQASAQLAPFQEDIKNISIGVAVLVAFLVLIIVMLVYFRG